MKVPNTEQIEKEAEAYGIRMYYSHNAGQEPEWHWQNGAEWMEEQLTPKWISIANPPDIKSGKFIGINKAVKCPSPIIVGYHAAYAPNWTDYYTEEEAFITHYTEYPKDK